MIRGVIRPLLALACLSLLGVLAGCGSEERPDVGPGSRWHVGARHPQQAWLPRRAHPGLLAIELPELSWTGDRPETTSEERFAVGVYADGSLTLGDVRLTLAAQTAWDGLTELRAWWATRHGPDARLASGPAPLRVEVYVDRRASWDRVRSVLLWLALPPHELHDTHIVGIRSGERAPPLHVPVHVGWREDEIVGSRSEGDAVPEWLPLIPRLPPLSPSEGDHGHTSWFFRLSFDRAPGLDRASEVLRLGDRVVPFPARLNDPSVVASANEAWAGWALSDAWAYRGLPPLYLEVWWGEHLGGPEAADVGIGPGSDHVPAAYPLQAIDIAHVDGDPMRTQLAPLVYAEFEPPAAFVRSPPPVVPTGAVVLSLLGIALAFGAVFAGAPPSRRDATASGVPGEDGL